MKYHRLVMVLLALVTLIVVPSLVFADLIAVPNTSRSRFSIGPSDSVVAIHENFDRGDGIESGCINPNGTFLTCLNNATTHVEGGDNVGINNVLSLSTNETFGAVVTTKDAAHNLAGTLTDLYLTFTTPNRTYTAEYLGPDISLLSGAALFTLSASDWTMIQSLGPIVTVSGGLSIAGPTAGPEALYVMHLPEASDIGISPADLVAVPEPGTFLLIGSGLVALIFARGSGRIQPRRLRC